MRPIDFASDRAGPPPAAAAGAPTGLRMVAGAWLLLAAADIVARSAGFAGVYRVVRRWRTRGQAPPARYAALVVEADQALVRARTLYLKRTRCLQRGVALTGLLRWHGVPASLVIGVQRMPFNAHAWVEVDGRVVSDGGASVAMYREMTRC